MSNTYIWTVTNLIGYPVLDGETDVVTEAFYNVVADDGAGHTAVFQSIRPTPLDPERPFVPYNELTNDIVVGWIQQSLGESGVNTIYGNLDSQIENQINPPPSPESLPLPWGSATGTVSNYVPPAPVAAEPPVAAEAPLIEPPAPDLSAPVN
jgi:hypothetical protein